MIAIEPATAPSSPPFAAGEDRAVALAITIPQEQARAAADQKRSGVPFVTSLPLRLDVKIPMPNFRLKDLAHLASGQVLQTDWSVAEDLPVSAGDVRLLWAEFAVADQQLTVRVTRVA